MDKLLNIKKADGTPLSIASAKREAAIVTATMNHALREFDSNGVSNPFAALPWPKEDTLEPVKRLPFVGEALRAAKDSCVGAEHGEPRYTCPRGADAASGALMKHFRKETEDSRLGVHSLRHRVSDKLREAGAATACPHCANWYKLHTRNLVVK